jgi:hypothetical protein
MSSPQGFESIDAAARMRDIIERVVISVLGKERPDLRIGKVWSIDKTSGTAQILFPGEAVDNTVKVRMAANMIPTVVLADYYEAQGKNGPGDVVRVGGKPGNYFIVDFVSGVPEGIPAAGSEPQVPYGNVGQYYRGDKNWAQLDKTAVGLANVLNVPQEPAILAGTSSQVWGGDKTWKTLSPALIGVRTDQQNDDRYVSLATGQTVAANKRFTGVIDLDNPVLNDHVLWLRAYGDTYHGLQFVGALNGPKLWGGTGGALATGPNGENQILHWGSDGVQISGSTIVYGGIQTDGSPIKEANTRVYSPNNKPSPGDIGAYSTGESDARYFRTDSTETQYIPGSLEIDGYFRSNTGVYDGPLRVYSPANPQPNELPAGGNASYYLRGDRTWQILSAGTVGLGGVRNVASYSSQESDDRYLRYDTYDLQYMLGAIQTDGYLRGAQGVYDGPLRVYSPNNPPPPPAGVAPSGGTTAQYLRGDNSWQTLNPAAVGLSAVRNVSSYSSLESDDLYLRVGMYDNQYMVGSFETDGYIRANQGMYDGPARVYSANNPPPQIDAWNKVQSDARYSQLGAGNVWTGQQHLHGGADLGDQPLYLRHGDGNHGLNFKSAINGPRLWGYQGGELGWRQDSDAASATMLHWQAGQGIYGSSARFGAGTATSERAHSGVHLPRYGVEVELTYQSFIGLGETDPGTAHPTIDMWRTYDASRHGSGIRQWTDGTQYYISKIYTDSAHAYGVQDNAAQLARIDNQGNISAWAGLYENNGNVRVWSANNVPSINALNDKLDNAHLPDRFREISYQGGAYTDPNGCTANGWYYLAPGGANAVPNGGYNHLFVENLDNNWIRQTAYKINPASSADLNGYVRYYMLNTWGPWWQTRITQDEQDARYIQKTALNLVRNVASYSEQESDARYPRSDSYDTQYMVGALQTDSYIRANNGLYDGPQRVYSPSNPQVVDAYTRAQSDEYFYTKAGVDILSRFPSHELGSIMDMQRGNNEWQFVRYAYATPANVAPTLEMLRGRPGDGSNIADGSQLINGIGDNYIGHVRTFVWNAAAKTVNFTCTHDDGCSIYVGGYVQYSSPVYTAVANVSLSLPAGWVAIDMLWNEQAGGDGIFNVTPTIGSQVANMRRPNNFFSKEDALAPGNASQYYRGDKTWQILSAATVGLGGVRNVASYSSQEADDRFLRYDTYDLQYMLAGIETDSYIRANQGLYDGPVRVYSPNNPPPEVNGLPSGGTTTQYLRGDRTWQNLTPGAVGLPSVRNVSSYSTLESDDLYLRVGMYDNQYMVGSFETDGYIRANQGMYDGPARVYSANNPPPSLDAYNKTQSDDRYPIRWGENTFYGRQRFQSPDDGNRAVRLAADNVGAGVQFQHGGIKHWGIWATDGAMFLGDASNGELPSNWHVGGSQVIIDGSGALTTSGYIYETSGNRVYSPINPPPLQGVDFNRITGVPSYSQLPDYLTWGQVTNGNDWNNMKTPGVYRMINAQGNQPGAGEMILRVEGWDGNWIRQEAWYIYSPGPKHVRYFSNGTWSAWEQLRTEQYYDSKYDGRYYSKTQADSQFLRQDNYGTAFLPGSLQVGNFLKADNGVYDGDLRVFSPSNPPQVTDLGGLVDDSHLRSGMKSAGIYSQVTDWNAATSNGLYVGVNAVNGPTVAYYTGRIEVQDTNWLRQTIWNYGGGTYQRERFNGTWQAWQQVMYRLDELDARFYTRGVADTAIANAITTAFDGTRRIEARKDTTSIDWYSAAVSSDNATGYPAYAFHRPGVYAYQLRHNHDQDRFEFADQTGNGFRDLAAKNIGSLAGGGLFDNGNRVWSAINNPGINALGGTIDDGHLPYQIRVGRKDYALNLNTSIECTANGFWVAAPGSQNTPEGAGNSGQWWFGWTTTHDPAQNNLWVTQYAQRMTGATGNATDLWMRRCTGTTWYPWKQVMLGLDEMDLRYININALNLVRNVASYSQQESDDRFMRYDTYDLQYMLGAIQTDSYIRANGGLYDGPTRVYSPNNPPPAPSGTLPTGGTTAQYLRGDGSWQNLTPGAVGLGGVRNVSSYSSLESDDLYMRVGMYDTQYMVGAFETDGYIRANQGMYDGPSRVYSPNNPPPMGVDLSSVQTVGGKKTWSAVGLFSAGVGLQDQPLWFRGGQDANHKLQYNPTMDGPSIMGYGGGSLDYGTNGLGGSARALRWSSTKVEVMNDLQIYGNIRNAAGNIVSLGATDSGWINIPLGSGWQNYAQGYVGAQYRKIGPLVYMRGLISRTGAAVGAGTIVGSLPVGYRPSGGTVILACNAANSRMDSDHQRVDVDINGNIMIFGPTTIGTGQWLSFTTSPFFTD